MRQSTKTLFRPSDVAVGPDAAAVLETCRLTQVKSGYTTAWLDLTRDAADLRAGLAQNWRNQLGTAERGDLAVDDTTDEAARDWLLEAYERHKAHAGYDGPSAALNAARATLRAGHSVLYDWHCWRPP